MCLSIPGAHHPTCVGFYRNRPDNGHAKLKTKKNLTIEPEPDGACVTGTGAVVAQFKYPDRKE